MQRHELESVRRSLAMSDSLPSNVIQDLIDTCDRLLAERVRIERILKNLGPAWGGARRALNELHRVLHAPSGESSGTKTMTRDKPALIAELEAENAKLRRRLDEPVDRE